MNKKLNVVVLYSSGHLGSIITLNRILKMKCYKVVGIVRAENLQFSDKGLKKLSKQIRKTGILFAFMLFWQRLMQALAYVLTYIIPGLSRRIKTSTEISQERNIPLFTTKNINDPETLEFMKVLNPDISISAYFPMILKKAALSIPKMGTLNIHPGWLPEYKGAMVYFWALKNNEPTAGVSVHWMDEGIDTGPLLGRKAFRLKKKHTQEKVLILTAICGSRILNQIGKKLQKGKTIKPINTEKEKSHYYSMPNANAYEEYCKHHKFFDIATIFSIIIRKE